ncbi:MAG: hypothetical protein AAFU85_02470, partial [Planctomycetota bacterium]
MNSSFRFDPLSAATTPAVTGHRRAKQEHDDIASSAELTFIARLLSELRSSEKQHEGFDDLVRACLSLVSRGNTVRGGCAIRREDKGNLKACDASEGFDTSLVESALLPRLSDELANGMPVVAQVGQASYVAVPTGRRELPALVGCCSSESSATTLCIGQLQLLATFLDSAASRRRASEIDRELRVTAAALELVQSINAASTVVEACQTLVTTLQNDLGCDQVFIGLMRGRTT